MQIAIIYLKGPWGRKNADQDKGLVEDLGPVFISLVDNEYGKDRRRYPIENVARIEYKDNWN